MEYKRKYFARLKAKTTLKFYLSFGLLAPFSIMAAELLTSDPAYIGDDRLIENEVSEREAMMIQARQDGLRENLLIQERLAKPAGGARASQRPDGIWCANSQAKFELKAIDDLSGMHRIKYRVNDGSIAEYIDPFNILQEGRHQIVYYGYDNAGNQELQQSLPVIVDDTPPEVEINPVGHFKQVGQELWAKPGFKLYSDASDKLCGLQGVYMKKDENPWEKATIAGMSFDEPGKYELKVLADDYAENRSQLFEYIIKIDNTKPTMQTSVVPKPIEDDKGKIFKEGSRIYVHPHDDMTEIARVLYRTSEDGEWLVLSGDNYLIPGDQEDVYFETKAVDALGYESESRIVRGRMLSGSKPIRTKITPVADEVRGQR